MPGPHPLPAGRTAIAAWCQRRYGLELDPETEILPVNGSREALFAFAQAALLLLLTGGLTQQPVLILAALASILPARNAARLTIREVLAYE